MLNAKRAIRPLSSTSAPPSVCIKTIIGIKCKANNLVVVGQTISKYLYAQNIHCSDRVRSAHFLKDC